MSLHPSCNAFLSNLPLSLKFTGVLYTQIFFSRFFSSSHPLNIDSLKSSNLGSLLHTASLRNTDSHSFTCHLCAKDFQTYPLSSRSWSCIHKYLLLEPSGPTFSPGLLLILILLGDCLHLTMTLSCVVSN